MRKFFNFIIKHRKFVIIFFVIAAFVCGGLSQKVPVDYDINNYLPEDSSSTVAINVMEEEFEGGIPGARVMVENVTVPEALEYKEQISAIDGVISVDWLDDAEDITIPLSAMDQDTLETYYKDNCAVFTVTLDADKRISVCDEIRAIIGDDNAMTGSDVSTAYATTQTVVEVGKIAVVAMSYVFIILMLTMSSFMEPLLILTGVGIAVMINMGSNMAFGGISFVTNAAQSTLQLAVSLDYSVFLLHRFAECRKEISDPAEAMTDALCKSVSSILSSGLTTVIGFLALLMMRFGIGPDLGMALAKGVVISLITVFVFLPALVTACHKLIDKTQHRPFMPRFIRFGKLVRSISIPMALLFLVIITPAFLASNANSYYYGSEKLFDSSSKLGQDTEKINEVFGEEDTYVLMVPRGDSAKEESLSADLHSLNNVTSIISYVDTVGSVIPESYLDEETLAKLESDNYSRMVLSISLPTEGEETFALVEEIREVAESYYPGEWYLAGVGVSTYDLMDTITADMLKVNMLAIGAIFVVLLFTMKSIILPVLLVLCIETAIWLNLSIPYFSDQTVFYLAYLIISSIQLGATVDYAILMSTRYKEFRETQGIKKSIVSTISSCTVSLLVSGTCFIFIGFVQGAICSNQLLVQLGTFQGRGGLFSLAIVLFVLPGMLMIFDPIIVKKKKPKKIRKKRIRKQKQTKIKEEIDDEEM